jgi:aspartate aminotransferase/aminotransferase
MIMNTETGNSSTAVAGRFADVVLRSSEAVSIRYNNLVYELRHAGARVITLSLGEAFFDIPLLSMEDLPFPDLYHYSHSRGVLALRGRLCRHYREAYGVIVDPEREILITAGSKAAIYFSLLSILNPGDEAIVREPAWVSYPEQVKFCGGVPVLMPMDTPIRAYERYLTPRSKVLIVNNPHNPCGDVLSRAELSYLFDLACANQLYVLLDEAYSDFVTDGSFCSGGALDRLKTNVILCNSVSKNLGISGWRIGYLISNPFFVDQVLKINQHVLTCPATILQFYVARYFETILSITRPQIADLMHKRTEVRRIIEELGLSCRPGNATFYFFISIAPSKLSSEEFSTRLLASHHVSVVPGSGYGQSCDSYVRVSIGTETLDDIRIGLMRLKELILATA